MSLLQFKDDVEGAYGNPLLNAASCPYADIFERLLSLEAIEIDGKLHLVDQLDPCVKDASTYRLPVTVDVMTAACRNTRVGLDLVRSLISQRGNEIILNEAVLEAIISNASNSVSILKMLPGESLDRIILSPDVIAYATTQDIHGCDVLDLLQDHTSEKIQIGEESLKFVVRAFDEKTLERVLRYYCKPVSLSLELLVSITQNREHGNEVLIALIRYLQQPMSVSEQYMH